MATVKTILSAAGLSLVLAAAALTGCGAKKSGPADQVRAAAHTYFVAMANHDYQGMCAQMSSATQAHNIKLASAAGADTCADAVKVGVGSASGDVAAQLRTDKIVVVALGKNVAGVRREHGTELLRFRRYGKKWLLG
jgi:hypothetical protein